MGTVLEISQLVVNEKYRRQGIATSLIKYTLKTVKATSKKPQWTSAAVAVHTTNTVALNLYQKLGFKIIDTQKMPSEMELFGTRDEHLMVLTRADFEQRELGDRGSERSGSGS